MNNTIRCSLSCSAFLRFVVLAMTVGLLGSVSAAGQTRALGTPGAGFKAPVSSTALSAPPIDPFMTYSGASYGTGGIALRNRGTGVLHVSGVVGRVQDAYLYWAILFSTPTPTRNLSRASLSRIFPNPGFFGLPRVTLEGTLLGIGADPCWGSTGIAVYRAQVPRWLATGNGAYQVTIASALTDGSDPWVSGPVFPAAEGASLVIVGTGAYTVGIYDAGFTATTFYGDTPFTYALTLPAPVTTDALWDNIGADGQTGASRLDEIGTDSETTTINGTLIAGPTSPIPTVGNWTPDSDWNGSAGLPIPQLWDDTGHDIFSAVKAADDPITAITISFLATGDCVVTVSNVLAVY